MAEAGAASAVTADTTAQSSFDHGNGEEEQKAAQLIQRNYRGYRERRQLQARWRQTTRLKSRADSQPNRDELTSPEQRARANAEAARNKWKRVGEIARRAGADDAPDASYSDTDDSRSPGEREDQRRKRGEQKSKRDKAAKMMDLQYFLEMVDQKHRYGSNLRAYHDEWKKSETHENFFYWLDKGEGRNFEHPTVSRERLEKEQVRYLSREERLSYLVKIDKEGRLCWAKNGERINTTTQYKDSVNGIVPVDDDTPAYGPNGQLLHDGQSKNFRRSRSSSTSSSSSSSSSAEHSDVEGEHYVNEDLDRAKGIKKIKHVSAATILNHLLRSSVKPNSWIFVADTSFRLYIGIKQSGAFQHSSFLHGARISAAGLVRIKDGQLRRLSPLSGHYRPPTKNFRAFVHNMQDNGIDMSRVSISRSYAVLVGLEAYVKTRRKVKKGVGAVKDVETKVVHPEVYEKKIEEQKDNSKSAQRERQLLADQAAKEEAERKEKSWKRRIWKKISRGGEKEDDTARQNEKALEHRRKKVLSRSGQDVESAIAPSGKRDRLSKSAPQPKATDSVPA
ncbi:hypothetical protein OPT61_g4689 [Boeremia exigua]|uniref:Uncharacterized protein n=1 Tax=Boeremia exigua TaxID=749465 RepID=A0ACC2IDD6_9PLEO|nr:hypothetical protein OPT61_g4689 [Boeremia exigua]